MTEQTPTPDPWQDVQTYVSDIYLPPDGDMFDVDVCLRTEVDAARAADQQRIADLSAQVQGAARFKEAVASALCVENEDGPVSNEAIIEAAQSTLAQLFETVHALSIAKDTIVTLRAARQG